MFGRKLKTHRMGIKSDCRTGFVGNRELSKTVKSGFVFEEVIIQRVDFFRFKVQADEFLAAEDVLFGQGSLPGFAGKDRCDQGSKKDEMVFSHKKAINSKWVKRAEIRLNLRLFTDK